jgi:hypothetical protein
MNVELTGATEDDVIAGATKEGSVHGAWAPSKQSLQLGSGRG